MTDVQMRGLIDLYARYQRTVTSERTVEDHVQAYPTETGFCVQIGHKTGVGQTLDLALLELEKGIDEAIGRHIASVIALARGDAGMLVPRFRFSAGGSGAKDIVGAVLGCGAFVVTLERLLEEQVRAENNQPLQIHEPSEGCVLVYPDGLPPVAVHLNALDGYA